MKDFNHVSNSQYLPHDLRFNIISIHITYMKPEELEQWAELTLQSTNLGFESYRPVRLVTVELLLAQTNYHTPNITLGQF